MFRFLIDGNGVSTYAGDIRKLARACHLDYSDEKGTSIYKRRQPASPESSNVPLTARQRQKAERLSGPERLGWRPLRAERTTAV
ncbi:MAG: hypothetical protein JXA73_14835 [Acidobacteria bacterium]|nr:hypothetical protein [Acidobacteriota bacterium]